jgi:hypothetical protein
LILIFDRWSSRPRDAFPSKLQTVSNWDFLHTFLPRILKSHFIVERWPSPRLITRLKSIPPYAVRECLTNTFVYIFTISPQRLYMHLRRPGVVGHGYLPAKNWCAVMYSWMAHATSNRKSHLSPSVYLLSGPTQAPFALCASMKPVALLKVAVGCDSGSGNFAAFLTGRIR